MNLEMKMRSRGNSGIARKGDKLTCRDPVAYRDDILAVMSVAGLNSVTVINSNVIAVVGGILRFDDRSRLDRYYRGTAGYSDVDTLMISSVTPV